MLDACLSAAAKELSIRGLLLATTLLTTSNSSQPYLSPAYSVLAGRPAECNGALGHDRIAVFGVSDQKYIRRYWTTFASLACDSSAVDLFLLVHSLHEVAANFEGTTPKLLRSRLTYVSIDFDGSFAGTSFHGAWPSVAYWWAAGPQMFGAAGYSKSTHLPYNIIRPFLDLSYFQDTPSTSTATSSQCRLFAALYFRSSSLVFSWEAPTARGWLPVRWRVAWA